MVMMEQVASGKSLVADTFAMYLSLVLDVTMSALEPRIPVCTGSFWFFFDSIYLPDDKRARASTSELPRSESS